MSSSPLRPALLPPSPVEGPRGESIRTPGSPPKKGPASLPDELLIDIFQRLKPRELLGVAQVSHRLRQISRADSIWRQFPTPPTTVQKPLNDSPMVPPRGLGPWPAEGTEDTVRWHRWFTCLPSDRQRRLVLDAYEVTPKKAPQFVDKHMQSLDVVWPALPLAPCRASIVLGDLHDAGSTSPGRLRALMLHVARTDPSALIGTTTLFQKDVDLWRLALTQDGFLLDRMPFECYQDHAQPSSELFKLALASLSRQSAEHLRLKLQGSILLRDNFFVVQEVVGRIQPSLHLASERLQTHEELRALHAKAPHGP